MTEGGNAAHATASHLPLLVRAAVDLASEKNFDNSCAPEQGQLLSVLAHGCHEGRVGETGTGCGVGLAWMVDAAESSVQLFSVEIDVDRAASAASLFAPCRNVTVHQGDWRQLRRFGPFDLLVLDGGGKGKEPGDDPPLDPTEWLAPGGTVVLDDFIPVDQPNASAHDHARDYWLNHPALRAIELRLSKTMSTIVGVRRP